MINRRIKFYKDYKKEQDALAKILYPLFVAKNEDWSCKSVTSLILFHIDRYIKSQKSLSFECAKNHITQGLLESTITLTASLSSDWSEEECIKMISEYFSNFKKTKVRGPVLNPGINNKIKNGSLNLVSSQNLPNYMEKLSLDPVTRNENSELWNHFFRGIDDYALSFSIETLEKDKDFMYSALFENINEHNYAFSILRKKPSHLHFIEEIMIPYYFKKIYAFRKKYENTVVNYELNSIDDYDTLMKSDDSYLNKDRVQLEFDLGLNAKHWISYEYNNSIEKCRSCNLPLFRKKSNAKFCDEICKNNHHKLN